MPARPQDAATFHALHQDLLILPNAWDAASAKIVEDAGAKAIATSSAALAWVHGFADGHHLPIGHLVRAVEQIAASTALPITVDAEGGYADDPVEVGKNIAALIGAGGVGINLEDGHTPHDVHVRKIEAAREAAARANVNLFINARTDVYLKKLVAPEAALDETLRRAAAFKKAGASGLFVTGITDAATITAIVRGTDLPLNVIARPGLPKLADLRALGVRRLSAAAGLFNAAMAAARAAAEEMLRDGDSDALGARIGTPLHYNDLFKR
jgi:2-methylisocitrate lyase-like PEP mutase family enzyme